MNLYIAFGLPGITKCLPLAISHAGASSSTLPCPDIASAKSWPLYNYLMKNVGLGVACPGDLETKNQNMGLEGLGRPYQKNYVNIIYIYIYILSIYIYIHMYILFAY